MLRKDPLVGYVRRSKKQRIYISIESSQTRTFACEIGSQKFFECQPIIGERSQSRLATASVRRYLRKAARKLVGYVYDSAVLITLIVFL